MKRQHRFEKYVFPFLIALFVAIFASLAFGFGLFTTWSAQITDRIFLSRNPDARIAIVAIDDASITQLGRWPWPRAIHAKLIQAIHISGALVIGYDVNFPETSDVNNDHALASALLDSSPVVLPVELQLTFRDHQLTYDPSSVLAPTEMIREAATAVGHTNTQPDADGVARRVPLSVPSSAGQGSVHSFVAEVARLAGADQHLAAVPRDALNRMIIHFPGHPYSTFPTYSAVDVIHGTIPSDALKGKIVFVGSTAPDLHDELFVPTSNGVLMPGVEIHASSLDTILSESWLRDVPAWIQILFFFLLAIVIVLSSLILSTRWSLGLTVVFLLGSLISSFLAFDRGWILDALYPFLVISITYVLVMLERRIISERERREVRQAFSRYVSPSVVESILQDSSRLKLGGERRRMTVLFSDIRGFTTISEGLNPEQLVDVLNIYLDRMTGIVFQYDGVLDKYIGDAVMAFWNAPFDQPDHAYRGLCTALDMRDALVEMNAANAFGDLELHIGLGVNTGEMVVGNVGGSTRFDYTVIGDNVNLGSRLEGITKEYGAAIITSAGTAAEVHEKILLRRLDKVAVKGKKEPVEIYECLERMEHATNAQHRLVADFEHALELYFQRSFEEAADQCDFILKQFPNDGPTKVLQERAKHFEHEPPPEGWIGTWVFTKK